MGPLFSMFAPELSLVETLERWKFQLYGYRIFYFRKVEILLGDYGVGAEMSGPILKIAFVLEKF